MRTDDMTRLRLIVQGLSLNGKQPVTNALLYEALGLDAEDEKARLRRRVTDMVERGELVRLSAGKFRYNPKAAARQGSELYQRVWRAIRSAKPGFSFAEQAQVSRGSYTFASRYGRWLEAEGYIERHGRDGNTLLYRATLKAREHRETPYPPQDIKDPFASERSAVCRLVRLMMERDPYQPAARQGIVKECRAVLARFEKNENEEATQ